MTHSFSGPSLLGLIPSWAGAVLIGGVYSSIARINYERPIVILLNRATLDALAYNFLRYKFDETRPKNLAMMYAITNLTVNCATLIIFRMANLIGKIGTIFFIALMAIELTCKCLDLKYYRLTSQA